MFNFQWDEHYQKLALKQRRGSIAYRLSLKSQLSDSASNTRHVLSPVIDESIRNGHQTRDGSSPVLFLDANLASNKKRLSPEEHVNGNTSPNEFAMNNSKTTLKSIQTGSVSKNGSLSNEKSSTTCTIQ
jgi:hypothetical protein